MGVYEVELRIAVAEGAVSHDGAEAIAREARRRRRSPLSLLVEQGRLTRDSFASLRALALDDTDPLDDATGDAARAHAPSPRPPAPTGVPAFPVAGWDRYQGLGFLGQGGMGQVFLARDLRLRRDVAIKFVRGDNPDHARRLVAEARAQARVSHERVCKVYEVGEIADQIYIAMHRIAGAPIGELAGELGLADKVALIRGAAEGIHAAHGAGIIHRDLKPANIMVERDADGALRPYVLDFGLAHSAHDDGATITGAVVGTPRYMAPEQATGQRGAVDHRADVYGLGATLYHLVTGQPPVIGTTLPEVVHQLASGEPRAPRAVDPTIPADLEAIVLKCLERDRAARYASARALADDLGRFLAGEPVAARAAGAWYRLRKRITRHRRITTVIAAALVGVMVAVSWAMVARRDADVRARAAIRFTERVERVEAAARFSALSPEHDVRGDRAAIRAQLADLERDVAAVPALFGPGASALGRAYLALDDDAQARAYLEAAWQHGFREPRTAYALALALGHLYLQQLLAAERVGQPDLRDGQKRAIERQYRDPALGYLAASRGAEVAPAAYVATLTAYYAGQLDDALHQLAAIDRDQPWFYEAAELRGDILLARALNRRDLGDEARAREDLAAGREAYAAAAATAHSRAAVYDALGELEYVELRLELYGRGHVEPALARTIAATTRGRAILPDRDTTLVLEARAYRSLAEYDTDHGRDADAERQLDRALADAQRAVELAPTHPEPRLELSRIYRQAGELRESRNQDPGEPLHRAIEVAEGIASADRDAAYFTNLGLIHGTLADYDDDAGHGVRDNRDRSIADYRRAVALDDRLTSAWINLGIGHYMRAAQPRARAAEADLGDARDALDRAATRDPDNVAPYFYLGEVHKLVAERLTARGGDPGAELARALAAYQRGVVTSPELPHLHNGIGTVHLDLARLAWDRGGDPAPMVDRARAAFSQAIAVAPEQGFAYSNLGEAFALRAWLQRARDEDPRASVHAAAAAITQAIARLPDHPTFQANLATAHTILAGYELEHGRDPRSSLAVAGAALQRALAINPDDPATQRVLGELRGLAARLHAQRGQFAAGEFEAAADALRRAIELAPEGLEARLALGELCRAWALAARAAGGEPGPPLRLGLELADGLLASRPRWPDLQLLHASLLVIQAQLAADPGERRALAARAADDFASAFAVNPALARRWRGQAARARQLAAGA
jgi:eukaryotic-like serine/threonine-protein kinase